MILSFSVILLLCFLQPPSLYYSSSIYLCYFSSIYLCYYSNIYRNHFHHHTSFALGALMLQYYVDLTFDFTTLNLSPSHPNWVGAWWCGFVLIGSLLLIVSTFFYSFPKVCLYVRLFVGARVCGVWFFESYY